jgi:hypothetical protein
LARKLIAVEGIRKADLAAAGKRFSSLVSGWDASGIFFELGREKMKKGGPSAKTLLMLYATDLAFRLRWEIEPALEEGLTVVAAPYVQTGLAFAAAAGVPKGWARELFRFAPKADAVYRVEEKDAPPVGFVAFCCATLAAGSEEWDRGRLREGIVGYLKKLEAVKVSGRRG